MTVDNYKMSYFCGAGGHFVPKEQVRLGKDNQSLCPVHGRRLRLKARKKTAWHKANRQRVNRLQRGLDD